MAKPARSTRALRNLGSTGLGIARFTGSATEKAATGLFRWAATNHYSHSELYNIPGLGFFGSLWFIFVQLIIGIIGSVIAGAIAFVMIAYGLPLLISLLLGN